MKLIYIAILIALLSSSSIRAQAPAGPTKHFDKNGLEFDYPANWKMTEGRSPETEYAEVSSESRSMQLIINWHFGAVLECEVEAARKRAFQVLTNRVATQIHADAQPESGWQKTKYGELPVEFVQLRGFINNSLVTADAASLLMKNYVLNLIYIRGENDEPAKAPWETIRQSIKASKSVPVAIEPTGGGVSKNGTISGGVLNGKATRLPGVPYPPKARAAGVAGTVIIQVLIDESGNVINVCPISGDALLRDASAEAARQAKFSVSKLSGKPVRVVGIVQYNFVYQGPH